ncbi:MAG: WD40/YVTN/BNR-like repeat-containing protein [Dehalococcoidia bacterium]
MQVVIGTSEGVFLGRGTEMVEAAAGLDGREVRHLSHIGSTLFAGADDGLYRSRDGGQTWEGCGLAGRMVWDVTRAGEDAHALYAVSQPAGLFRSDDGGDSWHEVASLLTVPGAERWCLPGNPPTAARARTVVLDRTDPARMWVGIEVGGVVASADGGDSWTCTLPGGNPDIHVLTAHPAQPELLFATTGYGRMDNSEPMEQRIAGLFRSADGGRSWDYLWDQLDPKYTRPMCIDPRPPHALTVACAPTAFSSHRDPGGAQAMLYQSEDGGTNWRPLGDAIHAPSAANFLAVGVDPAEAGGVLVGTDTGELWRVSSAARWTLLASGLPAVLAVHGST